MAPNSSAEKMARDGGATIGAGCRISRRMGTLSLANAAKNALQLGNTIKTQWGMRLTVGFK